MELIKYNSDEWNRMSHKKQIEYACTLYNNDKNLYMEFENSIPNKVYLQVTKEITVERIKNSTELSFFEKKKRIKSATKWYDDYDKAIKKQLEKGEKIKADAAKLGEFAKKMEDARTQMENTN